MILRRAAGVLLIATVLIAASLSSPAPAAATTSWYVPVLMYHHVKPASEMRVDEPWPDLFLDPALFDAQLAALKSWGWKTITAARLAALIEVGAPVPSRTLVLTFDDGRPDAYKYAFPILEKYGFKGTFYVVPGRIGTSGHMTAAQLKDLSAHGHDLGNHTWDHSDLTTLSYDQARTKIRLAGDGIEDLVGVRPTTMAYPYGSFNSTVMSAANAEDIYLAFTTQYGASQSQATRLQEERVRIHGYTRRSDGSYTGGTTAGQLLIALARFEGPLVTAPTSRLYAGATMSGFARVRTTWSAKDPTGISSYGLARSENSGAYTALTLTSATAKSLTQSLTFGAAYRYRVRATNGAGTTSAYAYGRTFQPYLTEEDGLSYTGSWGFGSSTGYSGGADRYTTAAGASVTYGFTGYSVAWFATKGPTRGSADVYLDGNFVATVSLHADSRIDRQVVYAASWTANGTHVLRIVNRATVGHPRIDIDGVLRLVAG